MSDEAPPLVPLDFGSGLGLPLPCCAGGEDGLSHEEPFSPPPPPPKLFLSKVSWSKLSKKLPFLIISSSSSSSARASALAAARLTALLTSKVAATPAATPAAIVSPPRTQVTLLCFLVAVPETTAVMDSAREPGERQETGGKKKARVSFFFPRDFFSLRRPRRGPSQTEKNPKERPLLYNSPA